jgi:LPXTG-site transpeptidase (sortase) family protein
MNQTDPLTPSGGPHDTRDVDGYVLPAQTQQNLQPQDVAAQTGANEAADLIRQKLERIYAEEPDPLEEEKKVEAASVPRSKHQQFMYELSTSGRSLADIQTAWHEYYARLPDNEKYEVWQEFYAANDAREAQKPPTPTAPTPASPRPVMHAQALSQAYTQPMAADTVTARAPAGPSHSLPKLSDKRSIADIRRTIRHNVSAGGRLTAKHHLHSLLFGLGVGSISLVIFLFGFFNEVIIAPFIQPSRNVGATPIIIDPSSIAASSTPEIIIPKIHLEIPVDYSQTSTNEATIENALENGIVHYPTTVKPGQQGNAAFFGHSSNNIFNPGKYKFAFVLLHELVPGDTFYITNNGKVYIYKVFSKTIVEPSDVNVLNNVAGHSATATLITCDPPGTSLHRLVVVGDQISPDPSTNSTGTNTSANVTMPSSTQLPGNGPTLWGRFWKWLF